jgi:hypothetical protein
VLNASGDEGVNVAVFVATSYETIPGIVDEDPENVSTTVELFINEVFIASLNVIVTAVFTDTPPDASGGVTAVTVGDVVSGADAVVNSEKNWGESALPATSRTPFVTVTEYCVPNASGVDGAIVAVLVPALYETKAGIVAPSEAVFSRTVEDVIVFASIDSLNAIEIEELMDTPAAPFAGVTAITVGGVVSDAPAVVKLDDATAASAFPPRSFADVETVSV